MLRDVVAAVVAGDGLPVVFSSSAVEGALSIWISMLRHGCAQAKKTFPATKARARTTCAIVCFALLRDAVGISIHSPLSAESNVQYSALNSSPNCRANPMYSCAGPSYDLVPV